ncbi:hypothetical protein ACFL5O_04665 [Myxococcota bacterium]
MLAALEASGKPRPFVKLQTTGPVSFGLTIVDENKRATYYNPEFIDVAVKALAIKWGARGLSVNRVPESGIPPAVLREIEATGLPLLAAVSADESITDCDASVAPVVDIPQDVPARLAVNDMLSWLFAAQEKD